MRSMVLAAGLAAFLATGPAMACGVPGNLASLQAQVAQEWNQLRRSAGLRPLGLSPRLSAVAQDLSCANADRNAYSHKGRDGAGLATRLKRGGYRFRRANENVGIFRSASRAVQWWYGSQFHRQNMLARDVTELGVGVAAGADGRLHWTGISAKPR
jgi:uncharacterized protein YkwD